LAAWRFIDRASAWSWGEGPALITCSAEDLVVHKVFAGRDRDWGDVEGILARQYGKLNIGQNRDELGPLLELKEEPEALTKLTLQMARVDRRLRGV